MLKRTIDIIISLLGSIMAAPLMALIALLIKLDDPGPVLYKSQRVGQDGRIFTMLKFRSMYQGSPPRYGSDGSLIVEKNDPRVTRIGKVLRLGLDELPQLLNVLKGDMSLVGPRPDPLEALAMYQEGDERRLSVRPGITGLTQVSGRTSIPWRERIAHDIAYVENQSLWLDLKIVLSTFVGLLPPVCMRRKKARMAAAAGGLYQAGTSHPKDLPIASATPVGAQVSAISDEWNIPAPMPRRPLVSSGEASTSSEWMVGVEASVPSQAFEAKARRPGPNQA